jgi:hypothetical protein
MELMYQINKFAAVHGKHALPLNIREFQQAKVVYHKPKYPRPM